jgi:hypothetical protein
MLRALAWRECVAYVPPAFSQQPQTPWQRRAPYDATYSHSIEQYSRMERRKGCWQRCGMGKVKAQPGTSFKILGYSWVQWQHTSMICRLPQPPEPRRTWKDGSCVIPLLGPRRPEGAPHWLWQDSRGQRTCLRSVAEAPHPRLFRQPQAAHQPVRWCDERRVLRRSICAKNGGLSNTSREAQEGTSSSSLHLSSFAQYSHCYSSSLRAIAASHQMTPSRSDVTNGGSERPRSERLWCASGRQ